MMTALILPFEIPKEAYYQRSARAADIATWNPHSNAPTGTCKWCGVEIDRKVPEDERRRNWHTKCLALYDALYWNPRTEAMKRDHGVCCECARDCKKLDERIDRIARISRGWGILPRQSMLADRALWRLQRCYGYPRNCASTWEADHIIEVQDGGGWPLGPSNIQTLCFRCHRAKTSWLM